MDTKTIVWDVDTQVDFIDPAGTLPVPGAHEQREQFRKVLEHFAALGCPILGTVDAHVGPEKIPGTQDQFFPLHCILGTRGQQKIAETDHPDILYVTDVPYAGIALEQVIKEILAGKRIYFHKQTIGFLSNPNAQRIIKRLQVQQVYLFGVATNFCVKAAHDAFRAMGIRVILVAEAMRGLDVPGNCAADALVAMRNSGADIYSLES